MSDAGRVSFIITEAGTTDSGKPLPQRQDLGSTTDEGANWKAEKHRMVLEIEALRKEKAQLLSHNEQLKQQIAKAQEKVLYADQYLGEDKLINEGLTLKVASLKQAHMQLADHAKVAAYQAREFEKSCSEVQLRYQELEDEAGTIRTKDQMRIEVLEKDYQELREKNQQLEDEAKTLQDKSRGAEESLKLLKVRMNGLKDVKIFFSMEDIFSGADVLRMVDGLNAEIFQTSAQLAELVENVPERQIKRVTWKQCISKEAYTFIEKRLGSTLLNFIEEKGPESRRDPIALQLAFQAILVWWSVFMVNDFADGRLGNDLGILYKYIRETEPQAVSARWRAITSEKIGKAIRQPSLIPFVMYCIAAVLKMGSAGDESAAAIRESVSGIEKAWKQIKTAVKEGIFSCELNLAGSDLAGVQFDPATMEDSYREEGVNSPSNSEVLCTVGVGLKRSWGSRSEGSQLRLQDDLLVKPQVVLSSIFTLIGES